MADEEIPVPDSTPDLTPGAPPDPDPSATDGGTATALMALAPMSIGREVINVSIEDEMRQSYLDYAMSTIIARALPDVRDGLKPVHRRILMAMSDLNLTPAGQHRKSAKIVGECFVAGTLVSTPRGLTPIEDLNAGDTVYTQTGVRPVTQAYVMPAQPLREVRFDNGAALRCTPGQQFKVWTPELAPVWKTADELTPGEYVIAREFVRTNSASVDKAAPVPYLPGLATLDALESPHAAVVRGFARDGVSFAQVRAVGEAEAAVTYDIQVEEDHEFIANGVLVHNCMGNYHPHGDVALYATMVRMAQDFNMRYPLVDGQGNFGCFTGDTKIKLLDGTEKSFAELAGLPADEVFHVYSVDAGGSIVVGEGHHARITRRDAELVEVTLDNGERVRCTPDHRFLLRSGVYKEAQHLTPQDSLMPGYFDTAPVKERLNDYLRVQQPKTGEFEFVHHLADRYNAQKGLAGPSAGAFVRHHKNFNRWDNRPCNIERMAFLEHLHVHAEHMAELWQDEGFRQAQRQGVQRYYDQHPEVREARRERMSRQNQDEAFRRENGKRVSASLKAAYAADPAACAEISRRMKALWADADYRTRMSAALVGVEKRPLTPQQKERVAQILSEKSRAMWGNDAKRAEITAAIIQAMSSEVLRAKLSENAKALWRDPAYRARYAGDHFSRMAKTLWADPAMLGVHQEKIARQWQDESFRAANRAARQKDHARRLEQNPDYMGTVTAHAVVALTGKWKAPDYKRQIMRRKIARYGSSLLAQMGRADVTPEQYESHRTQNWIPRLETALSYYGSFEELLDAAQTYNHKVASVNWLEERADVYDITVDEHHNFLLAGGVFVHNSIDADPPAAQRYTEARMTPFAMEMLQDLDRDTVDWAENYDQTRREPTVLPGKFPNFLCNGGSGIAVGMATNIPPHNLREIVDGAIHLLDNPEADLEELMTFIKGPDFPTASLILGTKGIRQAYATGRGSVVMQARTSIEPIENGRNQIVVTELPYQVIKSRLIEQIADLVKQKKIEGIADLNDYSDRTGMKIVITLKREAYPRKVLNFLLKHTPLRTTFGVNMLALVDGQPRILTLKDALGHFLTHRREVIVRRTLFELNKAKARAHILEGLQIALDFLDEIIALIRRSRTPELARNEMMASFSLSQLQADAILVMQLRALTGLEREKLENEYKELLKQIAYLEDILATPARVTAIIKQEMRQLRDKYGDERRTRIVPMEAEEIGDEDLIPEEEMIVSITRDGYIKRVPKETFPTQHRGGRGRIGASIKEEDSIEHLFVATTHHYILFFTDRGRVYRLKAYEVPQTSRTAMGTAVINLINIQPGERITATVPMKEYKDVEGFLLFATECGEVKRTPLAEFVNLRNNGLIVFDIEEDDALRWVAHTTGKDELILVTRKGMSIRFAETDLTPRSRSAGGVRGITLSEAKDDMIVGMAVVDNNLDLLVIGERGISKRTPLKDYRSQTRGGKGVLTMSLSDKTGDIVDAKIVSPEDRLLIMTREGITIQLRVDDIRSSSRNTQGVRAINLAEDDRVSSVERMIDGKLPAEEVV